MKSLRSQGRARRPSAPNTVRGFMMLEALVGLLIFTIGVLGLVGLQTSMVRAQTSANFRAEAGQLATDLVARMWVDVANIGNYTDATKCKAHELCNEWLGRVSSRLPGSVAPTVEVDKAGYITIDIAWVVPGETDKGGAHHFRTLTSVTAQPKAE